MPEEGHRLRFAPSVLREYAFLGDGERGALIGPHGEICWLCAPRWDSAAVFSELAGGRGTYAVTPVADRYVWGGYYEPGSLIWHSRWVTEDGIVECREALALPTDGSRLVLLRRILAVDGDARVSVVLEPRAEFGHRPFVDVARRDGRWLGRTGELSLRWDATGASVRHRGDALRSTIDVPAGRSHDLVLEISDGPVADPAVDPDIAWTETEAAWARGRPRMDRSIAARDSVQAWAVMRGLTSANGAMVAAATMALPERAEAGRNYDYRYAWIRDQCFAGQAAAKAGAHGLLDGAVRFVSERVCADGPELKPAYTTRGTPVPDEHRVGLPGYPGGSDRAGNHANSQFQLDALGEALLLFGAAAAADRLDVGQWPAVEQAVAAIEKRWQEPDAGIWELSPARWAHSRLVCAAGLRQVAQHAGAAEGAEWTALADTLVADTTDDCLHPTGRWQRAPDDPRIDASLLLPALRGAVPGDDPRSKATHDAVLADLARDEFVYRFRPDDRPLGRAEGAFVLCGFLAARSCHQQGELVRARGLFERSRSACGPPGLLSEEFDVGERQMRGNVPQAFAHALLLESAHHLAEPT